VRRISRARTQSVLASFAEKLAPAAFLYQFDRACLIEIGLRGLTPTSLLKPQLAIAAQAIGLAGR
jgi:hypothetical protein